MAALRQGTGEAGMTGTRIKLDSRKRVNLAAVAQAEFYIMTAEPSGRIILDPAVVVPLTSKDAS